MRTHTPSPQAAREAVAAGSNRASTPGPQVVEQRTRLDFEAAGDSQDRRQSWLAGAALEPAQHIGAHICSVGELFLREAVRRAQLAQSPSERRARREDIAVERRDRSFFTAPGCQIVLAGLALRRLAPV